MGRKKDRYDPRYHRKVFGGWIDDRPKKKGCLGLTLILTLAPIALMLWGAGIL
jgi:hypothetical protein